MFIKVFLQIQGRFKTGKDKRSKRFKRHKNSLQRAKYKRFKSQIKVHAMQGKEGQNTQVEFPNKFYLKCEKIGSQTVKNVPNKG